MAKPINRDAIYTYQTHAYQLIHDYKLTVRWMSGLNLWSVGYGLLTLGQSQLLYGAVIDAVNKINASPELRGEARRQGVIDRRVAESRDSEPSTR